MQSPPHRPISAISPKMKSHTPPLVSLPLDPGPAQPAPVPFIDFANAMAGLTATVCVATATGPDGDEGRTVTSIISLSAEPPSVLISITRGSALEAAIRATGGFSVAMLAADQQAVGDAFAGRGTLGDRFAVAAWDRWPSGRPKLIAAATGIDCALLGIVETPTHSLFAGSVIATLTSARPPLLWHDRAYRAL